MDNNLLFIGYQFNYLKSLTDKENLALVNNSKSLKIKKGEIVFFEKERLNELYAIYKGACKFSFIR